MTKSIRKYRTWLMAGIMILLMLAWLGAPASNRIGEMRKNRGVGLIDGVKITAEDQMNASKEIASIHSVLPSLFGIEDRDSTHWLLLSHEAQSAGYVGETADGEEFFGTLARSLAYGMVNRNFMLMQQVSQDPKMLDRLVDEYKTRIAAAFRNSPMTLDEMHLALAKLRGVDRMLRAYSTAPRLSDREAITLAKKEQDAAMVDVLVVPASLTADQIPEPDDAALVAHFEKFKGTKPGEGEYGIGYLLPRRVKLEWLTLSREAFEKAVELDAIEVRKRYTQNHPSKYIGDFAAERANVEKDMRAETTDKAMQDAQLVVQSEVVKATRLLEVDGTTKYKKLPADWEQKRPRLEAIAQAVADEAKKGGLNLLLPEVTVKAANWLTESELGRLPGIGSSELRQGGIFRQFTGVISWTRELGGTEPGLIPVQVNVPVGENYLLDAQGNRYYLNVLATRGESAPDSVAEIKEQAAKDFKSLRAYEQLLGRLDEFRKAAVTGGLDAVATLVAPASPILADPTKKDDKKPVVRTAVRATRMSISDGRVNEEAIRTALVEAAAGFDPLQPYGSADAEKATLALAAPKNLSVAVFRIRAYAPLTREAYRRGDSTIVSQAQQTELPARPGTPEDPFSLQSLLKRHDYVSGDEHIRSVEQLKRRDKSEG